MLADIIRLFRYEDVFESLFFGPVELKNLLVVYNTVPSFCCFSPRLARLWINSMGSLKVSWVSVVVCPVLGEALLKSTVRSSVVFTSIVLVAIIKFFAWIVCESWSGGMGRFCASVSMPFTILKSTSIK